MFFCERLGLSTGVWRPLCVLGLRTFMLLFLSVLYFYYLVCIFPHVPGLLFSQLPPAENLRL